MEFNLTTKEVCEHFKMKQPRLSQLRLGYWEKPPLLTEGIDYIFESGKCMYSESAMEKLKNYFDAKYYQNKTTE